MPPVFQRTHTSSKGFSTIPDNRLKPPRTFTTGSSSISIGANPSFARSVSMLPTRPRSAVFKPGECASGSHARHSRTEG
eukprot:4244-Eustigmatos_ZCMA.PRE.1